MSGLTVGNATGPLLSQSKSKPIVLSSLAMYPSSDIDADAMT